MAEAAQKKEVARIDPIYELLSANKKAISNMLPRHLTPERIMRIAYTAINRNNRLRDCTKASLVNGILEVSLLGLDLGRTAHLVPFKNGRSGNYEAVFIPDYKGYIELAHRSGMINSFTFKPVYSNDEFTFQEGTTRSINHVPTMDEERGDLIAAYAICFYKHGGYDFEIVFPSDIVAVKKRAPGAKKADSPWNQKDLEYSMWCKTAVRRLSKRVPQSPELQRAAQLEEYHEAGMNQDISYIAEPIDIKQINGNQKPKDLYKATTEPNPTTPQDQEPDGQGLSESESPDTAWIYETEPQKRYRDESKKAALQHEAERVGVPYKNIAWNHVHQAILDKARGKEPDPATSQPDFRDKHHQKSETEETQNDDMSNEEKAEAEAYDIALDRLQQEADLDMGRYQQAVNETGITNPTNASDAQRLLDKIVELKETERETDK